jgi:hypothetical protein
MIFWTCEWGEFYIPNVELNINVYLDYEVHSFVS